ncbi:hypothetical protein H7J71_20070 [Mycolicibacterium peregrinum]|uniref:zinc ribbon domain-containing protein n=1 Tax=Mycolicibacterium peregrinum TaxID=43304 RepID=UPI0006D7E7B4|nr:zinc ribbon domain-containing protein [Mycolicibacterium peregrinum]MCV7204310.1 hypothetical protein [Mycolicibacterium peregrinum]ORW50664.1 hypothetical protein AWC21_32310 [Mycolicibacterium peregrinum]
MPTCPNGHSNPAHWEFCNECGAPIDEPEDDSPAKFWPGSRRKGWLVAGAVAVLLAGIGVGASVFAGGAGDQPSPRRDQAAASAVAQWWAQSHDDVSGFRAALHDSQQAIALQDAGALLKACQQLHDTAGVRIPARLPSPDSELTSELQAAAQDAHEASHMCLAAAAGSMNSYRGEFAADIAQADKHLAAAQEIVDQSVTSI